MESLAELRLHLLNAADAATTRVRALHPIISGSEQETALANMTAGLVDLAISYNFYGIYTRERFSQVLQELTDRSPQLLDFLMLASSNLYMAIVLQHGIEHYERVVIPALANAVVIGARKPTTAGDGDLNLLGHNFINHTLSAKEWESYFLANGWLVVAYLFSVLGIDMVEIKRFLERRT